jgi:hypothetical protein
MKILHILRSEPDETVEKISRGHEHGRHGIRRHAL